MEFELLFPVFSGYSGVVEFVSVLLAKLYFGKTGGLLDDGLVKYWVVEGRFVFC